ncbi:MAG: hypothetical protein COX77_01065 [Candidatus Komeilibacteria bacterium CG_4_10_14_0_2_um_filter_37_10]|uniref:Uncharacterized protein n=1 Tax=Candidatus Komeilibacteria bacterium CG_4_10_14_0_2_um_filter_37_10 TaxID=1974470 RepID=A0A2M7VFW7_9BACT|nr:MAG: hypothetical protein COX77_01065 [Candidatus Komeilibacteria bacterium CG_4_10_14_0_2_um_filter_37_10]PJA92570.1 MAG: hypothetical protein CO133_02470 [Candidatus Komeilibacteria bacterium CG_4_9_14_3_um_filter_37_5]
MKEMSRPTIKEIRKDEACTNFEQLVGKIGDLVTDQNLDQLLCLARKKPFDSMILKTKDDLRVYLQQANKQTIIKMADLLQVNYIALELAASANKNYQRNLNIN